VLVPPSCLNLQKFLTAVVRLSLTFWDPPILSPYPVGTRLDLCWNTLSVTPEGSLLPFFL